MFKLGFQRSYGRGLGRHGGLQSVDLALKIADVGGVLGLLDGTATCRGVVSIQEVSI